MVVRSPPPVLSANKRRKVNRELQLGYSIRGTFSRGERQPSHHHGESLVLSPRRTDDAPNRRKVLVQGFLGDMERILEMGQQFFFFHSDRLHFMMLASIQDDVPKDLSLGGVNQCMRGEDGRKGSKRTSGSEKNPTAGYVVTLSVRVVNAVTDSFPRQRNRALVAAQQELLRVFQLQFFGGMIRLLRAGDLGSGNFDTPSLNHRR